MSWEQRPLESHVEFLLKNTHGEEGRKLWTVYESTRDEVLTDVLKWIASEEPNLSDHGQDHIADVMNNAALLIGLKNEYSDSAIKDRPHEFSAYEMLILIAGILFHDIGNVYGRKSHNVKIQEAWSKLACWKAWGQSEKKSIIDAGRAHTGKKEDAFDNTLEPLSKTTHSFLKQPITLAPIAAIIRFADELAEGPQRTSNFMQKCGLFAEENKIFHQYSSITSPAVIDIAGGRIALKYHIEIDNENYPKEKTKLTEHLSKLLEMTYSRIGKVDFERRYARHYSSTLSPFREVSVSINFYNNSMPIRIDLEPIVLNDLGHLEDSGVSIQTLNPQYGIQNLVNLAVEGM